MLQQEVVDEALVLFCLQRPGLVELLQDAGRLLLVPVLAGHAVP